MGLGLCLAACSSSPSTPTHATSSATVTPTLRQVEHTFGPGVTATLEVPAGWSTRHGFVGDTGGTEWFDPNAPTRRIALVTTGCIGCMKDAGGRWDVQALFGGNKDITWTFVSGTTELGRFTDTAHTDPFAQNGATNNPVAGHIQEPYVAYGYAEIITSPTPTAVEVFAWTPPNLARPIIASVRVNTNGTQ